MNRENVINILQKCVSKMLDIFNSSNRIIRKYLEIAKSDIVLRLYNISDQNYNKKIRSDNEDEYILSSNANNHKLEETFNFMVEIVDVLNSINFLNDENILTASNISRLPNLIVKFFFCAMHIENQNLRLNSLEKATNLLKYLCNKSKMYRQSCQRNLLEKGIFTYGYLFGCYDEPDSMDFGTKQEESLLEQNRKQIGANTHRSVLHAGVIGDGLKKRPLDSFGMQPNNELQNLFLKAITSCCIDIEKPSSSDGFMTLSLLLVEFISTDVMYNGLPFPEDEFTKSTVERDLLIKRAFLLSPMLWSILSLLAQYRPALCLSSVLLRAICSTCLLHWKAKNGKFLLIEISYIFVL